MYICHHTPLDLYTAAGVDVMLIQIWNRNSGVVGLAWATLIASEVFLQTITTDDPRYLDESTRGGMMALLRAESADLEPRLRQGHHITSNGLSFAALLFIGT